MNLDQALMKLTKDIAQVQIDLVVVLNTLRVGIHQNTIAIEGLKKGKKRAKSKKIPR